MCNIEELVGPNLQEVFAKYQQYHFSNSTIALIGIQVVKEGHGSSKSFKVFIKLV